MDVDKLLREKRLSKGAIHYVGAIHMTISQFLVFGTCFAPKQSERRHVSFHDKQRVHFTPKVSLRSGTGLTNPDSRDD